MCNCVYDAITANQKYCGSVIRKEGCSKKNDNKLKIASRKRNRYKHLDHQRELARGYQKKTYQKMKARGYFKTEEYKAKARKRQHDRYWGKKVMHLQA